MVKPYEQIGVAMTCRGFEEYMRMFALEPEQLAAGETLDVAGGASSFTAEACRLGYAAHAVDPRYALEPARLALEAAEEIETSTAKLAALGEQMDYGYYGDLANHRRMRVRSLERFAEDYANPDRRKRYTGAGLPELPFKGGRFTLVTVSHFLFLYAEQFDYGFHLSAVQELLRVCAPGGEVRIYPLVSLRFERYPHLDRILQELGEKGLRTELAESRLPFVPGSTHLLRLIKDAVPD